METHIWFYNELQKYKIEQDESFDLFIRIFDWLPIAAIIEKKLFCVHGGINNEINSENDEIEKITIDEKCNIVEDVDNITDLKNEISENEILKEENRKLQEENKKLSNILKIIRN